MEARVEGLIELMHGVTDKSVAVGFGVSGGDQVSISLLCPGVMICQNAMLVVACLAVRRKLARDNFALIAMCCRRGNLWSGVRTVSLSAVPW